MANTAHYLLQTQLSFVVHTLVRGPHGLTIAAMSCTAFLVNITPPVATYFFAVMR